LDKNSPIVKTVRSYFYWTLRENQNKNYKRLTIMLAEKALELIRELQRTTDGTLPPFNVMLV
jgi:hypothetical protein